MYLDFPPGADPRDPRVQRIIQGALNQHFNSGVPPKEMLDNENYNNMIKAQTAAVVADIRQVDARLFKDLLTELRSALSNPTVCDGDKGNTERPPIAPSFDTINTGKLQEAYLNVVTRYVKYLDTICERDLEFAPPKSLADKAKAPEVEVKKTRKKPVT